MALSRIPIISRAEDKSLTLIIVLLAKKKKVPHPHVGQRGRFLYEVGDRYLKVRLDKCVSKLL